MSSDKPEELAEPSTLNWAAAAALMMGVFLAVFFFFFKQTKIKINLHFEHENIISDALCLLEIFCNILYNI